MRILRVLSIAAAAVIVVMFGWFQLGLPLPYFVAQVLTRLELPGLSATRTLARDTPFYPGAEIEDVFTALVAQMICDQNIPCTGQQILEAGTQVKVSKEITIQNGVINRTFAKVSMGRMQGWIDARAFH